MTRLVGVLVAAALTSSCATNPKPNYKLYPGPVRPAAELAVVRVDGPLRIDGLVAHGGDWRQVELLPGYHSIGWERWLNLGESAGVAEWVVRSFVEVAYLEAGRVYALGAHATGVGERSGMRLQDVDSGELIAWEDGP
jgi:hypothetical protein